MVDVAPQMLSQLPDLVEKLQPLWESVANTGWHPPAQPDLPAGRDWALSAGYAAPAIGSAILASDIESPSGRQGDGLQAGLRIPRQLSGKTVR
jgi:hypothetical protein